MRKAKPIRNQLLRLKERTGWSWERICRELHRIMGEEGPCHTTLFRYGEGQVNRPNVIVERWISVGVSKLEKEASS